MGCRNPVGGCRKRPRAESCSCVVKVAPASTVCVRAGTRTLQRLRPWWWHCWRECRAFWLWGWFFIGLPSAGFWRGCRVWPAGGFYFGAFCRWSRRRWCCSGWRRCGWRRRGRCRCWWCGRRWRWCRWHWRVVSRRSRSLGRRPSGFHSCRSIARVVRANGRCPERRFSTNFLCAFTEWVNVLSDYLDGGHILQQDSCVSPQVTCGVSGKRVVVVSHA